MKKLFQEIPVELFAYGMAKVLEASDFLLITFSERPRDR